MTEWEKFCAATGAQVIPASPSLIARFIYGIADRGIERVWEAVQEISRMHYVIGLPDPTGAPAVTSAINVISGIQPPRSWPKEQWERFSAMPYDMQRQIVERETERDRAVRNSQNEVVKLKQKLKEIENAKTVAA